MSIPEYHCTEGHTIQPCDWLMVEAYRQKVAELEAALLAVRDWAAGVCPLFDEGGIANVALHGNAVNVSVPSPVDGGVEQ